MKNIILAALTLFAFSANAASVSYDINTSDHLADGVTYATVTLADLPGGDIGVTVVIDETQFSGITENFGMQSFAFNADPAISADAIIDLQPSDWKIKLTQDVATYGIFDLEFQGKGNNRTSTLSFTISADNDTLASYAVGDNYLFATHIAGYNEGGADEVYSGKYAATLVPVPAAVWLLGSALGLLVCYRRK